MNERLTLVAKADAAKAIENAASANENAATANESAERGHNVRNLIWIRYYNFRLVFIQNYFPGYPLSVSLIVNFFRGTFK